MSSKLNFKAQMEAFRTNAPEYVNDSYFFWDWFCQQKALKIKSKLLMTKAEKVMSKLGLDPEKYYVTFKNNCPVSGKLYDSFQICTYDEAGDVVIWCAPSLGYKQDEGKAQLVDMRVRKEEGEGDGTITAWSWKELTHKLTTDPVVYAASFDAVFQEATEEPLSGQVIVKNLS
jgi:hypothetical protein